MLRLPDLSLACGNVRGLFNALSRQHFGRSDPRESVAKAAARSFGSLWRDLGQAV